MTDFPLVRLSCVCPLCGLTKRRGLVACWRCFSASGLKDGLEQPESEVAAVEETLRLNLDADLADAPAFWGQS